MPILTTAQAEAIYSAMCALNNVGGTIKASLPHPLKTKVTSAAFVRVFDDNGAIRIVRAFDHRTEATEYHEDQSAFATAYGLQQG